VSAQADLDRIYRDHPFQKRTILARIARQGLDVEKLNELDLAVDRQSEITDQNHIGGAEVVSELAAAARVSADSRVVDLGSGLGGSTRLLAHMYGCRVWGIESHEMRHREAMELTAMVGLEEKVVLLQGDVLTCAPPVADVDVLWGQSTWAHFPDLGALLARWVPTLRRRGRVACEDSFLKRTPRNRAEETLLANVQDAWQAQLLPLDAWRTAFRANGCRLRRREDLTGTYASYLARLRRVSRRWPEGDLPASEAASWRHAARALRAGLIGYFRLVAQRS
jgi:cyclopropane fatty-acyl-phospholipid synthase-like methyltransferase